MPTIADVAALAGVSRATVSRVVNGHPAVDQELAARVRAAVQALGYRPSRVARSLRIRRTRIWAFVISDIRNVFFTEIMRGVEETAWSAGHTVIVCNTDEQVGREREYLEMLLDEHVAGVIIAPASSRRTDLSRLRDSGTPVVVIDRDLAGQSCDTVVVDNIGGARAAVEHLLAGGYEHIGCVTGPAETSTGRDRQLGWARALQGRGLPAPDGLVRYADFKIDGGRTAMLDLLSRESLDAVFVANNLMTTGALQAIGSRGLEVPVDLGLVGFDDGPWSTIVRPALSAVRQPTYEIGERAAGLLLHRLEGFDGPAERVVLRPELIVRDSSSPRSGTTLRHG